MDGILLSCEIKGIRSLKDGSISITLETPEISGGKAGEIFTLRNRIVAAYISPKDTISQKELSQVDKIDVELKGKSQSQRIRSVLFLNWEHNNEGYKDFELFYRAKTELYIETLKSNLPER